MHEVCGKNAVYFKKGDTADLKSKLEELLGDSEKVAEYKKCASEYVCSKYNWDDITDKTLSIYGRI